MEFYPSFNNPPNYDAQCICWDKLDGQTAVAEISSKKGFHKFGSKKVLIDESHPFMGESVGLIKNKYQEDILKVMKKFRVQDLTCYFEFFGPNSAFGRHQDEQHDVVLFDVLIPKQGIIDTRDFLKTFGHLDIPRIIHQGKVNKQLIEQIWNDEIEGITFEGVVCKTNIRGSNYSFKLKTKKWMDKLREYCSKEDENFEELA